MTTHDTTTSDTKFQLTHEHVRMVADLSWSKDNSRALEWYAPGFRAHLPGRPVMEGGQAFMETVNLVRAAKPDLDIQWHDVLIEGNRAVLRLTFRGHQLGPLFGIPPTGRYLEIDEIMVETYDDQGRMVEYRQEGDYAGMLMQMGIVPPMGTGPLGQLAHSIKTAIRLSWLDRNHRKAQLRR